MNSQISFTADQKLKKKAMQKAKEKGITLKSVLILSLEAFVDGKISVGVVPMEEEVEELEFDSPSINKNAEKLASLLK